MNTNRSWLRGAGTALLFLPLLLSPATAADPAAEIGIQGGFQAPDEHLTGEEDFLDEIVPAGGLRAALHLSERWWLGVDGLLSKTETKFPEGDATMTMVRGALEWHTPDGAAVPFFLSGGAGWMFVDMEKGDAFDRPFASLGLGQRYPIGDTSASLRWELRGDATFYEREDIVWEDMIQAELLVGLSIGLGGDRDTDGDGVKDKKDNCPGTPLGARVDMTGCPTDADVDGVWDGLDVCPDTPRGAKVDPSGCPKDSDGDGVFDGIDRCAQTPKGALVDATGCPMDEDGDGVFDGIDRCPDTPKGTKVDARGCPELFEAERSDLTLEGVNFESGKDVLTGDSRVALDRVAASLKAWPEVRVEIGGHTDSNGAAATNLELSRKRAEAVMRYLIDAGVPFTQLEAKGYGEENPVADNKTAEGRAKNRRVELKRMK